MFSSDKAIKDIRLGLLCRGCSHRSTQKYISNLRRKQLT